MFLWNLQGFFTYKIILSRYRDAIFFFQCGCLYFSFLPSCSGSNVQFYVNRSDARGHPVLLLIFGGSFWSFTIVMLAVGFSYICLYHVFQRIFLCSQFECFYEGILGFIKWFFYLSWNDYAVFQYTDVIDYTV